MKIVVTSMMADPFHVGHLECLERAKELGGYLLVLVDSDEAVIAKKGYVFMPHLERVAIINALKCVDAAIPIYQPVAEMLKLIKPAVFAKGGDRTIDNLPQEELDVCKEYDIKIVCGLGAKIQSSSELVRRIPK